MKKPLCPTHNIPMEPSATILINKRRRITSEHTCPECSYFEAVPQHIIDNAKRSPSPSRPKPKQRVKFDDAIAMFKTATVFKPTSRGKTETENINPMLSFIEFEEVKRIIKKLTR